MREEWRPVVGYEGLYEVSNMGRVRSVERTVWDNRGYYKTVQERIRKPQNNRHGYLCVVLAKDGKIKNHYIHRLVAEAFIQFVPEANASYEVDHRNTVRTDNRVSNLCYVTSSQNSLNPKTRERYINNSKTSKPVIGIDMVTGLIVEFASAHEAERQMGIAQSNICACLKGRKKSTSNFYWYYADTTE